MFSPLTSSSCLRPQQDTSRNNWIMFVIDIQLYDSRAHVYSTCCHDRLVKVDSGELTGHKHTTTSRTEAQLSGLLWLQEALQTPLYCGTHWTTCMSSMMSRQRLYFPTGQGIRQPYASLQPSPLLILEICLFVMLIIFMLLHDSVVHFL